MNTRIHPIGHVLMIYAIFQIVFSLRSWQIKLTAHAQEEQATHASLWFSPALDGYDLDIPRTANQHLAHACGGDRKCICINDAIFRMDSAWATKGVGKKTNNPGNMRVPTTWAPSVPLTVYRSPGNGEFAKFETLEDGITANVELYKRFYADLPATTLVERWAKTKNPAYHGAVASCF